MAYALPFSWADLVSDINDIYNELEKIKTVTDTTPYSTISAYLQNSAVAYTDGDGGFYPYAGTYNGVIYFARLKQVDDDATKPVYDLVSVDSNDTWTTGETGVATLDSPAFYNTPTAPTPLTSNNSTRIATTAFTHNVAEETKEELYSAFVTETLSNTDIASFTDGADNIPVKSLTANISPVQDLHGYDNPWPSGGSVNLIPDGTDTSNGYVAAHYIAVDGSTVSNQAYYVSEYFPVVAGQTYTWSSPTQANAPSICFYDANKTFVSGINAGNALPKTFTVDNGIAYCRSTQRRASDFDIYGFQLEKGSSATALVPYSNICPISGWTGCNITVDGVNLFDVRNVYGYDASTPNSFMVGGSSYYRDFFTGTNGYSSTVPVNMLGKLPLLAAGTYVISFTGGNNVRVTIINDDGSLGDIVADNIGSGGTFTLAKLSRITIRRVANSPATYTNFQINVGSTAQTYEPYNGQTVNVSWTSAGTVYGGTLTYLGGGQWSVQPTQKYVDLNSLTWVYVSGRFRASVADIANIATRTLPMLCSVYQVISDGRALANVPDYSIYNGGGTPTYLFVHDSHYADATSFNANVTGVVLYPLATLPDPIILTAEDVKTLLGNNNIFTDVGSIAELTYRADTALYINKLLNGNTRSTPPTRSLSATPEETVTEETETEVTEDER